jgi:hypothetical protein
LQFEIVPLQKIIDHADADGKHHDCIRFSFSPREKAGMRAVILSHFIGLGIVQ